MSLTEWFNRKTGRRFWYQVNVKYRQKNSDAFVTQRREIGLSANHIILNDRVIKKTVAPTLIARMKKEFPDYLNNGTMFIEEKSYLGWFKKN